MKKKYVVTIDLYGCPLCCFESYSVNKACKFLETIDFELDGISVAFYREFPFMTIDIDSVLEVMK